MDQIEFWDRDRMATYVPASCSGGAPAISKDADVAAKEHSSSMMEEFGRFSPVKTLKSDTDLTDECFDPAYAEENAGA